MAEAKDEGKKEAVPQSDLEKRMADLEAQNKGLVKEAMEKKDQIRQLEEQKKAEEEKTLKEQNKYKELYESNVPKLERLNKLEPTLNAMLETEVAEIPEDKRDLIPQFNLVEEKLHWVRQAKAKGLFAVAKAEEKKPVIPSIQSKTASGETSQEFLTYPKGDRRLEKLSLKDYALWKAHNNPSAVSIAGWGGNSR